MLFLFGTLAGGLGAELSGGNFWQGAATGLMVSGLNHAMHLAQSLFKKYVVAGIYGAGGKTTGDNPLLEQIVEEQGGTMFTSLVGEGDSEVIEYMYVRVITHNFVYLYKIQDQ